LKFLSPADDSLLFPTPEQNSRCENHAISKMSSLKSDSKCEQLRKKGNQLYANAKFIDALICYNEALCYAEKIDSKEAALVFANRSVVYMNLGLPEQCLKNIELARNAGYPAEKMESLNNREKKCHEMIAQKDPAAKEEAKDPVKDFFKLSYPAHEKIPYLANCVEMRENKKYGRGLYATQDLKPGDVIAAGEPVAKALFRNGYYKRCTNCVEVKSMSLMPCSSCVSAMFCSKKCQGEAMEKFHQFECPHKNSFAYDTDQEKDFTIIVRLFAEARYAAGGLDKLKAICSDKKIQQKTFFDYDLSKNNNPSLEINQLLAAIGQISSINICKPVNPLKKTMVEEYISKQPFRSAWKTPDEKEAVKKILMPLCDIRAKPLYDVDRDMILLMNPDDIYFGNWKSLSIFNFNHSCSPNVSPVLVGNQTVYIVDYPIKKDGAILQCYEG